MRDSPTGGDDGSAEAVVSLRRCASDLGATPTKATYDAWAATQRPMALLAHNIAYRCGSWGKALRAAGLDPNARPRRGPQASDEASRRAAVEALRRFAAAVGALENDAAVSPVAADRVSRRRYDLWRFEQDPDAPSVERLRRLLGRWPVALHAAGLASCVPRSTVRAPASPRSSPRRR